MSETVTISPDQGAATSSRTVQVGAATASASMAGPRPQGIPAAIPRSQLYYWTRAWQEGEAAALADLEAGRSRVFGDPRDLARYLLQPDDDE